jgi:hypothetical protein
MTQEQLDAFTLDLCNDALSSAVPVPMSAPSPPQPAQVWWYRVSFLGGIALRVAPDVGSAFTGWMLPQNETFAVSEHIQGADGRVYLLLSDGRGWAFDDSALMPHDPSVVRGRWSPMGGSMVPATSHPTTLDLASMMAFGEACTAHGTEATKKRRRRKRGGVKRNKNRRAQANLLAKAGTDIMLDMDTDAPSDADENAPLESASAGSELEVEVVPLFKEEDFPLLVSS